MRRDSAPRSDLLLRLPLLRVRMQLQPKLRQFRIQLLQQPLNVTIDDNEHPCK